jgi:hypothetical protein
MQNENKNPIESVLALNQAFKLNIKYYSFYSTNTIMSLGRLFLNNFI